MPVSSLSALHASLGITPDFVQQCRMPLHEECTDLVALDPDVFGRPARLERQACAAWLLMRDAASRAGISLHVVSAYRSYQYQTDLLQRKLERGLPLAEILRVNAAPGFSEHHSGRALDLGTGEGPHLEESFEDTDAFHWLVQHAHTFGFRLSFPRNNPFGVLYEPWHWFYCGAKPA